MQVSRHPLPWLEPCPILVLRSLVPFLPTTKAYRGATAKTTNLFRGHFYQRQKHIEERQRKRQTYLEPKTTNTFRRVHLDYMPEIQPLEMLWASEGYFPKFSGLNSDDGSYFITLTMPCTLHPIERLSSNP